MATPEVAPMTAVQDMTEPALPRRRNGKPRSCEPCRLAKAACDHTLPRCGRCIRRGIDDRCTYHPAPMTKVQGPAKILRRPGSIRKGPQNTIAGVSSILSLLAQQHSPSGASEGTSNSSPQNDTEPQYLGSTSYSAVFLENRDSMGAEVPDEPQDKLEDCTLDNGRLRKASDALRAIPDQEVSEMLLDCSFEVHNSPLHEPTTRYCLQSLWDIWGDTMKNRDNDNKLRKMAADILRNTDTPIVPAKTAAEWLESHTGKHLRFEIIGTLLCLFALALVALPDRHSLFRTLDLSPRQYVYKLGRAAESCINVCTDLAVVNEFTLYLNYHATVVQSIYRGDDHGFLWRKPGNTFTTITALGLHRESTITKSAPFMVVELRKRMFTASFIVDKQLATLFGRPPRLSRRYSSCSLPLDLDDEEIMLQGSSLSSKLSALDAAGWSTEAKVTQVGALRATMIASLLRDEILELSLGPEADCTSQRRDEVKAKSDAAFTALPAQYRYTCERDIPNLLPAQLGAIITLKLEFLLNSFLLDRLHTPDAQAKKQALVDTAIEILHVIICFFGRGDCAGGLFVCSSRLSVYFGIPASGVLANELLKQAQYPRRYGLSLPRSQVIQDLSVFNHYLEAVTPCNGNYVICSRFCKVIGRVLDRVLGLEPTAVPAAGAENGEGEDAIGQVSGSQDVDGEGENGMLEELPEPDMGALVGDIGDIGDMEFMEWMSGVDWSKGPWTENF